MNIMAATISANIDDRDFGIAIRPGVQAIQLLPAQVRVRGGSGTLANGSVSLN